MKIQILTVGRKHEPWVESGIGRFLERLRGPFDAEFEFIPHSGKAGLKAAEEESERILRRLKPGCYVVLLDERGKNISSPELSEVITKNNFRQTIFVIGGAYGVTSELRDRADLVWSLSRLVFPHQLVRLILAEQLYRTQEIAAGRSYHHD